MSKNLPVRPRQTPKATLSFAIVASQYNPEFVQSLSENARRELDELEPGASIVEFAAPGSFEIPLLVSLAAAQKRFDAILALGVVIQGETAHAQLIAQSVTNALQEISLKHSVPVIHGVLLVANEDQARERCLGTELNRGIETARAAVISARTVRELGR